MQTFIFGYSASNVPILAYKFGIEGKKVLIIGGVHGDEAEGVIAATALVGDFSKNFSFNLQITIVPALNIDGVLKQERRNANGVDLNRNLPTNDWSPEIAKPRYHPGKSPNSEPENKALVQFIEDSKTELIFSLHSWKPLLNINGNCLKEAEAIKARTGYEIKDDIGYPTPGSLGTYTGLERQIPTLTYEIENGLPTKPIIDIHVPAIIEGLKATENI